MIDPETAGYFIKGFLYATAFAVAGGLSWFVKWARDPHRSSSLKEAIGTSLVVAWFSALLLGGLMLVVVFPAAGVRIPDVMTSGVFTLGFFLLVVMMAWKQKMAR